MKTRSQETLGKVQEVTLWFWIIKIAATTLGETGGDAVTMSMNLGYLELIRKLKIRAGEL